MTVQKLTENALALLPVKPGMTDGLMDYAPLWASLAAAECLPSENALRAARGDEELPVPPVFSSLSDEIPYDERIQQGAMVYALGALAAKDDGDPDWAATLRSRFTGALRDITPWVPGSIADLYGGDDT